MLIPRRKTADNLRTPFLSEAVAFVNEQSHTVWRWLHLGNFPNAAQLTRNRFIPKQDMNSAQASQAIIRQERAQITVHHFQGYRVPVTLLHLRGALDAESYLEVIDAAQKAYDAGTRNLIFDMRDVSSLGLSSVLAFHSIAVLLRGEQPLDPTMVWHSLRPIIVHDLMSAGLQAHFKLLSPQPQVVETLEQWSLTTFLEVHSDIKTALASF